MEKAEPLPAHIKDLYFKGKSMPSLGDYDVVGFDADHCIVKYNVKTTVL